jgi:hypothetical protein
VSTLSPHRGSIEVAAAVIPSGAKDRFLSTTRHRKGSLVAGLLGMMEEERVPPHPKKGEREVGLRR